MLISVCIPHYNRAQYLLVVLESIRVQDYSDVEVIISDDCSSDDSEELIPRYIKSIEGSTPVRFNYIRQARNLGYDGNLRASLDAAHGDYLFVLGNDDALPEPNTLSRLAEVLTELAYPDVCFTNFQMWGTSEQAPARARITKVIGGGPEVALKSFRSFSFVGGVVIKGVVFKEHNTDKYDGTVYVQMFLAARIIASGGRLAPIAESMVAKDVEMPGEVVNSYVDKLFINNRTLHREYGGLDQVGRVACEAILPYVDKRRRQRAILKIYAQLLFFTYPYWLVNYRERGAYRAALNLALGCFPTNLVKFSPVSFYVYCLLTGIFAATTLPGLLVPISVLGKVKALMSRLSKGIKASQQGGLSAELDLSVK